MIALKHILGDLPVIQMLDFFINNSGTDFSRAEIAHYAEIGGTATKASLKCLTQCGVVIETRRVDGVPLYELDIGHPMTEAILRFDAELTDYCTDKMLADIEDLPEGREVTE